MGYGPTRMTAPTRAPDAIVDATIEIIDTHGYDAVALRDVAKRARVSLGTIYKRFPTARERDQRTRDLLIAAALATWIDDHVHVEVTPPRADESPYDGLMRMLRYLFEPWERSPHMLEAYHRVTGSVLGAPIYAQTFNLLAPVGLRALEGRDPTYVQDVETILGDACDAAIARFAEGRIGVTDILPRVERVVYRLTTDNEALAEPVPSAVSPGRSRPSADHRRPTASAR